jgi:hypothetical protein
MHLNGVNVGVAILLEEALNVAGLIKEDRALGPIPRDAKSHKSIWLINPNLEDVVHFLENRVGILAYG